MLIQAYKESWMEDFNTLRKALNKALIYIRVSIEHVGSTSVPLLAAKPILDIDIVYGKDVSFEAIKMELEKIGYYHNGNQGISNREVFKRRNTPYIYGVLDRVAHHLYVCPIDSEELQKHVLLRDYLRTH